jgi:hypothetical protein
MKRFRKLVAAVPLYLALIGSIAFAAAPGNDRDDRAHRYYDRDYRDYHTWNTAEQSYWRGYWTRERRPYVSWNRASNEQRRAYWRWRHEQERRRNHR